jgi:hypothetical protein
MPGSDGALASDDFEPGEIAGMTSAGWILVAGAVLASIGALVSRNPWALTEIGIDSVLGFKLLRLRHSWRAWAMARALIGAAIGVLVLVTPSRTFGIGGAAYELGQVGYCVALLLLLYSRPSARRVKVGRLMFVAAIALVFIGGSIASRRAIALHQPAPQPIGVTAIVDGATVLLTGPTGERLAARELPKLQSLVRGAGKPWVVVGHWPEASSPTTWPVDVYFEPESEGARIRRGRVMALAGKLFDGSTPDDFGASSWEVVPIRMRYAHVARDQEDWSIPDNATWNRPFIVDAAGSLAELADDDIVSVAQLLWTDSAAHLAGVKGTWPIEHMTRMGGDSVAVVLTDPNARRWQGQQVTVTRRNNKWTVTEVSSWAI